MLSDGRGVSAYQVDPESGAISHLQDWTYRLPKPGVVKDRQDAAHPHQTLFDPSGNFILVPDLGADMIRTFRVDGSNVQEHSQIRTVPGTGPRHGAFVHAAGSLRYLLVGELSNTVTVFTVSYSVGGDSIDLVEDQTISTLPKSHPRLSSTAAEIVIKDSFVYVSNRGDSVFYGSDSIALYRICCNGMLELCGFYESGVRIPRHISIDPSGEWLVATGQGSRDVKVFRRNRATGGIGDRPVATYNTKGGAVCATWL